MAHLLIPSRLWNAAAVLVLLLGGLWIWVSAPLGMHSSVQEVRGPWTGHLAPEISAEHLFTGEKLTWSDLEGKPTVLNFWASWCPPCRREIPVLIAAHDRYGENLQILGIVRASDAALSAQMALDFGIDYLVASSPAGDAPFDDYEILSFPTTFFVDSDGVIQLRHIGELNRAILAEGVSRILN